jgi:hypothetical protein
MQRALHMCDELHSRNTAASLLFTRELLPFLLQLAEKDGKRVDLAVQALTADDYFFLRLSMAAAKAMADAAHGEGSTLISAMSFNCRQFAIRVGGLGDEWFGCACRKSNPDILMMQPAQYRSTIDVPCPLNSARYWRILLHG